MRSCSIQQKMEKESPPCKRSKAEVAEDSERDDDDDDVSDVDERSSQLPNHDEVSYVVITNDGTPDNMVRLITLKNIFAKQLPKMPKEYIVRLVMDRRHYSIALMKDGFAIGGICFRPYHDQKFAEIAFCAVTGSEQVKGYGTSLMNELKQHVKRMNITHFLTYADNYAIGYFKKQGFSKVLLLPRERWYGYIKDYDGGTLMECYIHPTVDFLHVKDHIKLQQEFVLSRIKSISQEHIIRPGLTCFMPTKKEENDSNSSIKFDQTLDSSSSSTTTSSLSSNAMGIKKIEFKDIPGMEEAGWGGFNDIGDKRVTEDKWRHLVATLATMLKEVHRHSSSWPFHKPVDIREVPDYMDVIKDPIDMTMIKGRLTAGYYKSKEMMQADLNRMMDNCRSYNSPQTVFYKEADTLQAFVDKLFRGRA